MFVPRNLQANESNLEEIVFGGSHKQAGTPRFLLEILIASNLF